MTDMDFLLGVYDETRMGGLRFSLSEGGPFLSDDNELATPPRTTLRKLESASLAFEKNEDGMEEKWCRIVFSMSVSNTDDHLRNHGFLLTNEGWVLSPMYDVNPNAEGDMLSLNVDECSDMIDFDLALSVAEAFGLHPRLAEEQLKKIKGVVENNWKLIAKRYGLSREEIENMAPAFDMRFK